MLRQEIQIRIGEVFLKDQVKRESAKSGRTPTAKAGKEWSPSLSSY